MSGTSITPLQNNRLLTVSTTTSKLPVPENAVDIGTFLSNRGNFYGGYSICEVSFINNFYNVTHEQTSMNCRVFHNNMIHDPMISVKPGQWFLNDLITEIIAQLNAFALLVGWTDHPGFFLEQVGPHDTRLKSTNFFIYSEKWPGFSNGKLATLLGFVSNNDPYDMSFQDFPNTPLILNNIDNNNLQTFARFQNGLDRFSMVYLHSNALKHDTSYASDGKTTNMVQAIPNNSDFGDYVHYSNELGILQPHFIFSQVRELTQIDFYLTDETGKLLECVDNNLQIVVRLFY